MTETEKKDQPHLPVLLPVYWKLGPVLVPEDEGRAVRQVTVGRCAVTGDGHRLSYDSHYLVFHHCSDKQKQKSIFFFLCFCGQICTDLAFNFEILL